MASAAEQLAANLNFGAFAKAEELKKRIWFTLGALLVYRLGTYIPIPGIDPIRFAEFFQQQQGGIGGMLDLFTGGAVGRMAIFALTIMPYISASIIIQLMTTVSPHLEQLKKEGEQGRKQINQYTRYGTVLLATLQGYGIAVGLESFAIDPGLFFRAPTVITPVGGTIFLMCLGGQITSRGGGSGGSRGGREWSAGRGARGGARRPTQCAAQPPPRGPSPPARAPPARAGTPRAAPASRPAPFWR